MSYMQSGPLAVEVQQQQGQQQPPQGGFQNDMQPGLDGLPDPWKAPAGNLTVAGMETNHTELGEWQARGWGGSQLRKWG